jgi:hypothetical protein
VEVICEPQASGETRQGRQERARLMKEFYLRSGDHNTGGSTRRPVVTAYREAALRAASILGQSGPLSVEQLRDAAGLPKVGQMLQRDVYGWFDRVDRGTYRLSAGGEAALVAYADVLAAIASRRDGDGETGASSHPKTRYPKTHEGEQFDRKE